jgi:uncharacterized membrane protein (DUF2068 family)
MSGNSLVPKVIRRSLHSPDTAALRAIALFESSKGLLVLAIGVGLLFFLDQNLEVSVVDVLRHMRLDPASRVPHFVVEMARRTNGFDFRVVAGVSALYALVRFTEAYGLWFDRAWGEWIGALSGGIYLPFEANEAIIRPTAMHLILLIGNVIIVLFLAFHLWKRKHHAYRRMDELPRSLPGPPPP